MKLPINWIKDENGNVTGYHRHTEQDVIAAKETLLLEMYEELQVLKNK